MYGNRRAGGSSCCTLRRLSDTNDATSRSFAIERRSKSNRITAVHEHVGHLIGNGIVDGDCLALDLGNAEQTISKARNGDRWIHCMATQQWRRDSVVSKTCRWRQICAMMKVHEH